MEVTARLRYKRSAPIAPLPFAPTNYAEGRTDTFNVLDLAINRIFTVQATLRKVTPNAYFYYEVGRTISQQQIEASAKELEEKIVPAVRRLANPDWNPGAGIDTRITILHANVPQVGGYYSFVDQLPVEINKYSNQRPMVVINTAVLSPGTPSYYGVIAHELQHAAQSQADPYEETWIQEGAAEYVAEAAGYPANLYPAFIARTDVQLTSWDEDQTAIAAHYGAAHLFMKYLAKRFGTEAVTALISSPERGVEGIDAFVKARGVSGGFDAIFGDWLVALSQDASLRNGLGPLATVATLDGQLHREGDVHQYGVDYFKVTGQNAITTLTFQGTPTVAVLPVEAVNGAFWYSNRGDSIDTTLTRAVDLSSVTTATLNFKLWFEIEPDYDYAYVEVSRDAGKTWDILQGKHSITTNPLDQAFGPGYSGKSSGSRPARWVDESVDLTPYAGAKVLLRFEYITDNGTNYNGAAFDDFSIPEIGFRDGADSDNGWEMHGFVRSDNKLTEHYLVRFLPDGQVGAVNAMALDANNRGTLSLPANTPGILIVSALAPVTTVSAHYALDLQPNS